MVAGKIPRKTSPVPPVAVKSRPNGLAKLPDRLMQVQLNPRPRRFSLIYSSSESSLSNVSDVESQRKQRKYKNITRNNAKGKRNLDNSSGKNGRLIQNSAIASEDDGIDSTDSSNFAVIQASGDEEEEEDDDDDDDQDDSSSMSSSDDDVDFVRLTAERKKKALQVLNNMKMKRASAKSLKTVSTKNVVEPNMSAVFKREKSPLDDNFTYNTSGDETNALAFSFKEGDGIQFGADDMHNSSDDTTSEDLGEEIKDDKSFPEGKQPMLSKFNPVDEVTVPLISESEESEYDFDQDAYFRTLEDDNENATGIDTALETADDDMTILDAEEENMMQELANDDNLSFDGSIHEEGEDPVDKEPEDQNHPVDNHVFIREDEDEGEYEDELMSDFDMPFYEDPKFANLYYCDSADQSLPLSTSLPLIINDEKRKKRELKHSRHLQHRERLKRSKSLKREHSATPDIGSEEYVFGLFFNSDGENKPISNTGIDSALRRLSTTAIDYDENSSDDEEYENILLDIAHMPTDDDSIDVQDEEIDWVDASDMDGNKDDDDDDVGMSKIFIDIDDLDPDAFYFHYGSSSERENSDDDERNKDSKKNTFNLTDDYIEAVVYVDNESTDEDETLPPPNSRTRKIGSKAKEVVSANTVGLKPPKLGTWKTDTKPFSIIDGLSTKSLIPLIQEHQQLLDAQNQQVALGIEGGNLASASEFDSGAEKEELTLNELLNMSELDDEEGQVPISGWYENNPKVPLSAFRNKGVNVYQDEEYMLPTFSARKFPIGYIGSERTRRKIDKMKELQKKNDERKRKLRKRKKLLKLKRKRALMEKEKALKVVDLDSSNMNSDAAVQTGETISGGELKHETQVATVLPNEVKNGPTKPMNLEGINNLLNSDPGELVADHDSELNVVGADDVDILASLTAPISCNDTNATVSSGVALRRRQSMAETAAAENLRFTKNGLFSENALADLEEIMGTTNGGGNIIELN
ncbi:Ifh1p Ecym_4135 [Eremothecium cymbalariae DBVPG|uniref:Protein IFH1 n=1 Tax=Eremothecium cymbalariae (strain CBS 270.75 / DBVPG 7215 / KCTC 17166 / NRRL Y-17582) TaxID=931890 RepID=G8JT61_ERECY|nr:hypothetical protein Ecym_4135 [Eremothecium cymbalariae DBVPG\